MSTTYEQLEPVISALDERIKTSFGAFPTDTASGVIATFIDGADNVPVKSLVVGINPVQSGEGDPSPTNIRPINGWMGVKVSKSGVNLWDEEWVVGTVSSIGVSYVLEEKIRSKNYIPVKQGTTLYFKSPFELRVAQYDASKTFISYTVVTNGTLTMTDKTCFVMFTMAKADETYDGDISINYPATDTAYHLHAGETIDISFPTEAGTVYGGSLDVTNGVLTVDRATVDLGTMSWFYQDSAGHERFGGTGIRGTVAVPASGDVAVDAMCSRYKVITANQTYSHNAGIGIAVTNSDGTIYVYDDAYTDSNAFRTAMSGVQFCYPLATPITYQLIPHEVKSLLGYNNIWADTGGTTVGYRADTSDYIAKKIAEAISALS